MEEDFFFVLNLTFPTFLFVPEEDVAALGVDFVLTIPDDLTDPPEDLNVPAGGMLLVVVSCVVGGGGGGGGVPNLPSSDCKSSGSRSSYNFFFYLKKNLY